MINRGYWFDCRITSNYRQETTLSEGLQLLIKEVTGCLASPGIESIDVKKITRDRTSSIFLTL